jgi:hypothetical protein
LVCLGVTNAQLREAARRHGMRSACAEYLRAAGTASGFVNDLLALIRHLTLRRITLNTPEGPVSIAAPAAQFSDVERGQDTKRVRAESEA